jgi:hypothetical protein
MVHLAEPHVSWIWIFNDRRPEVPLSTDDLDYTITWRRLGAAVWASWERSVGG